MKNKELALKMKQMFADLQDLDVASAIASLDERLSGEADVLLVIEMKITKAKLLSSLGRRREAIGLLEECSRTAGASESAAYFAAEILVEDDRLPEAVAFLEWAEHQIDISGSTYYKDCIFLLHAFCEVKQGRAARAEQLLGEVTDEDEVLFWLKSDPVISVFSVRDLIAKGD